MPSIQCIDVRQWRHLLSLQALYSHAMCGLVHYLKKTLIRGISASKTGTTKHSLSTAWKEKENRDINGREIGWRASWTEKELRSVQYSEKLFPVFVLTSSLISVMQRNWSEARKMKALTSKQSTQNKKKGKKETYGLYQSGVSYGTGCIYLHVIYIRFEYKSME